VDFNPEIWVLNPPDPELPDPDPLPNPPEPKFMLGPPPGVPELPII
jgi:hypothetical protein